MPFRVLDALRYCWEMFKNVTDDVENFDFDANAQWLSNTAKTIASVLQETESVTFDQDSHRALTNSYLMAFLFHLVRWVSTKITLGFRCPYKSSAIVIALLMVSATTLIVSMYNIIYKLQAGNWRYTIFLTTVLGGPIEFTVQSLLPEGKVKCNVPPIFIAPAIIGMLIFFKPTLKKIDRVHLLTSAGLLSQIAMFAYGVAFGLNVSYNVWTLTIACAFVAQLQWQFANLDVSKNVPAADMTQEWYSLMVMSALDKMMQTFFTVPVV